MLQICISWNYIWNVTYSLAHETIVQLKGNFCILFSAADDIPHADEVRTLIKDIWDLRIAKLRKSIDIMVSQQEVYARVSYQSFIMFLNIAAAWSWICTW